MSALLYYLVFAYWSGSVDFENQTDSWLHRASTIVIVASCRKPKEAGKNMKFYYYYYYFFL